MSAAFLSYQQRAQHFTHPLAKKLLSLMQEKKTNLAVSADLVKKQEVLNLAAAIGPEICVLKTHVDILEDFDMDFVHQLQALAKQHQFLIFEDRKFADIGNTVKHQFQAGIYKIADWADIINAHSAPGESVVQGLKSVGANQGCLLIAQMSSKGNLMVGDYVQATVNMALAHNDFVIGFIAQERLTEEKDFIYFTPGVNLEASGDALGQNYLHPNHVITTCKSDVMIVGRGIYHHHEPLTAAKKYREIGWNSYLQRLK